MKSAPNSGPRRRFRYYFNKAEPYIPQAPEVTEARQQGDCKAKSVWLASKMDDRNARYAMGKAKPGDKMSHAWLLWSNGGGGSSSIPRWNPTSSTPIASRGES